MNSEMLAFLKLAEQTLQFHYQSGSVTPIFPPHGTGWRRVPGLVSAQCVNGRIHLQAEDHATFTMSPGEMFVIPHNLLHNAELISGSAACSRWSHVHYSILDSIDVIALLDIPLWIKLPLAAQLGDINAELAQLFATPAPTLQQVIRRKMLGFQFLSALAQLSELKSGSLERLNLTQRIAPALAHIHAHLDDDLNRDSVAEVVHLSGSRFQTIFREALGMPPRDYIQRQRMQKAQQLLIGTALPINEVGRQSGHSDPFHFSRAFKKSIGVSPAAYRKQSTQRSM